MKTRLVRVRGPGGRLTFGPSGEAEVVSARGYDFFLLRLITADSNLFVCMKFIPVHLGGGGRDYVHATTVDFSVKDIKFLIVLNIMNFKTRSTG